jgi:hypothetical protein
MSGAAMVHLGRQELDVWLGEPEDFILAVLRDIYADEAEIKRWLNTPHNELGGRAAVDLLSAGKVSDVESMLVDHWNGR